MKLRIGDEIVVTRGKDHGKHGKIEKILLKESAVLIPGVNIYKKHVKSQGQNKPGGIIDLVKPLPSARIALVCPSCGKQTRIGFKVNVGKDGANGQKTRICRKCGKEI